MKKLIAWLLAAILMLSCSCALAETVYFIEDSRDFDIEMILPEGATVGALFGSALVSLMEIRKEGLAKVMISVAPSDLYGKRSMNDLTDEEIEGLKETAGAQYEAPEIAVEVTPSGNKYIYLSANAEDDMDAIFTLYMGYFIELTQWHENYAAITEADHAFMLELLHNIEFKPVV